MWKYEFSSRDDFVGFLRRMAANHCAKKDDVTLSKKERATARENWSTYSTLADMIAQSNLTVEKSNA